MFQWRKNKAGLIVILALLVVTTAIAVSGGFNRRQPKTGQIKNSQEARLLHLLRHDCGSCHGMTLKGGLGKPLLPQNFRDIGAEGIAQIILDGVPGTPMPPWRGLLTQDEALWIANTLKKGL